MSKRPPYVTDKSMLETKRRCLHRDKHIAWCRLLAKFCNAPPEYETCPHYKPRKK